MAEQAVIGATRDDAILISRDRDICGGVPTIAGTRIEDKLLIKWEYNLNLHDKETMVPVAARCGEVLRWFVDEYRRGAKS